MISVPVLKKVALAACLHLILSLTPGRTAAAQELPQKSTKFIKPIILSDFNGGSLYTNLGGLSGGDENKPGILFASTLQDEGYVRGNSGTAVALDYDVERLGEYTFYWMKLGKEIPGKPGSTESMDLANYNYLSFWVKGAQDVSDIKVELHQDVNGDGIFSYGTDITSYVYANAFISGGIISKEWSKAVIPLKAFGKITDSSKISELVFVFENKAGLKKGIIYVDDILFGNRPEDVLSRSDEDKREISVPDESSFKVNGKSAKECVTFNGANDIEISTESFYQNPFLESVRFEYSVDKGNTWRTISVDYDLNGNVHKFDWEPDNSRELYNYQLRAVASDIRGVEKATGVLIDCKVQPLTDDQFLNLIEKKAFEFFRDHQDPNTGLFADTSGGGDASIASTGIGLAALCIGAERGWIDKDEAGKRAAMTLDTFLPKSPGEESNAEGRFGFFYHFLNRHTAKRAGKSEISTVDTAILVCGAITAGEYFGGEMKRKAEEIYKRVEWEQFLSKEQGPWYNIFSMGWSPERGFLDSYWDFYTDETILVCLLAIGSPTHPVDPEVFYAWTRQSDSYETGKPFVFTWHGALFSYQYANLWFDLRNMADKQGIDWFENSTNATLANRQFCIDNADKFKGYGPNSWGITSMARPGGYIMHFGVPPTGSGEPQYDGTISPTGPAGSIVFTPYLSTSALKYMYMTYPRLWGQYGLKDSFNLDLNWYAPTYYGIGVGMILVPVENFRTGFVWKNFMKNEYVQNSLVRAGFAKKKG
ncbi:MAG: glucoamylase family protein [Candidatus Omnitrophota bacterium]